MKSLQRKELKADLSHGSDKVADIHDLAKAEQGQNGGVTASVGKNIIIIFYL